METAPRTLIDILSPDRAPANVQKIIIPMIQRDYAQGRKDPETAWIREQFLDALLHAVTAKKPMTLDFIYGDVDANGVMTPLDGQQRLTTLFLLYWYAAKKEEKDCAFLKNFGYTFRPAAQDFCTCLLDFMPTSKKLPLSPNSEAPEPPISGKIVNQAWFNREWEKDPTVSSMLVMLDAIEKRFWNVPGLWKALAEDPAIITFYFLPIQDMSLTDALYLKMNSRGKPLTAFEHFKAALERELRKLDEKLAHRIISKIDQEWTDLLWPCSYYINDDPDDLDDLIGNEFLQYFKFFCDILYCDSLYRQKMQAQKGTGKQAEQESFQNRNRDVFYLLTRFFSASNSDTKKNILLLEKYFDCWRNIRGYRTPGDFLDSFISETHEEGKIVVEPSDSGSTNIFATNIFEELLYSYDAETGQDQPFPVPRMLLLYAFITYLRYQEEITEPDFRRRIRIVNNLIRNSEEEIKKQDRIPEMLGTIYSIIRGKGSGKNSGGSSGEEAGNPFNDGQMQEEREKAEYLEKHPDAEEPLSRLEDHPMLHGQISIVLLNLSKITGRPVRETDPYADWFVYNTKQISISDYAERFEALFPCNKCEHRHKRSNCHGCPKRDWDKIDRALMALGDYSQQVGNEGYYQFASSKNPSAWDNLFHRSSNKGFENTSKSLIALLKKEKLREFTQKQKFIFKNPKSVAEDQKFELNNILNQIANKFLTDCEKKSWFPWQYYYVAYKEFRQANYGKMYNPNKEKNPYLFTVLSTKQQLSPSSYIPDLRHIEAVCKIEGEYKYKKDSKGTMLQWHEYKSPGCCITCTNNTYEIWDIDHFNPPVGIRHIITITQTADGIDTEDRIKKLRNYLEEHVFPKRTDLIQNPQKQ